MIPAETEQAAPSRGKSATTGTATGGRSAGTAIPPAVLETGLLLLDARGAVLFADPTACVLLGATTTAEAAERWLAMRPAPMAALAAGDAAGSRCEVACAGRPAAADERLRLAVRPVEGVPGVAQTVLVTAGALEDALDRDLALALQLQALTGFHARMAHDVKTPLNTMAITLELLRDVVQRAGGETGRDGDRYVSALAREFERLTVLVGRLVAQGATARHAPERLDLREVVREVVALLEPRAREHKVALASEEPATQVCVFGRHDRLKGAMLNVVMSEIDAVPAEGGTVALALRSAAGRAVLTVAGGDGAAVSARRASLDRPHVSRAGGGTEVGLYVAGVMLAAHDGTLDLEQTEGGRSVVRMTVPLLEEG